MKNSELLSCAEKAAEKSYSKYSGFRVGAALLDANGRIYSGCNIENASYSLTVCAERTAVFKAVSDGSTSFEAIAIVGGKDGDFSEPCPPCGACLQVMSEFCGDDFRIILADAEYKLSDFLPVRFSDDKLKAERI